MTLNEIKNFGDFMKWVASIPSKLLTVIKEGGEDAPLSARRVALVAFLFGAGKSLPTGLASVVEIATVPGVSWTVAIIPMIPFAICAGVVVVIVTKLTATNIAEIAGKLKG